MKDENTSKSDEKFEELTPVDKREEDEREHESRSRQGLEMHDDDFTSLSARETPRETSHVMDICSLVLGIISIVSALFWYITLPSGVLSVVFGTIAARKNNSKLGKAGLILGIVGLSMFAFIYVSFILVIVYARNY